MKKAGILERFSRLAGVALLCGLAATAAAQADRPCSVESLAGNWVFATEVGQQALFPDQEGDITAIGTMNLNSDGTLSGVFDATVANFTVLPDIPYSGSVAVGSDCRGVLTFVTGTGSSRTDSIVIVNQSEFLGMSQDTANLWTYQARRISSTPGTKVLEAKIDALLRRLGLLPAGFEQD